jgi:hypothetical protein
MTPRRLSSLAGAAALAAAVTAGAFALAQNTQPSPSTPRPQPVSPTTPTSPTNPVQPTNPNSPSNPNNPANPANPNVNPPGQPIEPPMTRQPGDLTGAHNQRLFMLETGQEARFNEFSTRLTRLDQQLTASNDQLMRELGDARQAGDTNARVDKLASILQKSLQQNRQLQAEVSEIRMALTGTGASTTPGAPGVNPPTTTPRTPSSPSTPNTPTNPPRGPGG